MVVDDYLDNAESTRLACPGGVEHAAGCSVVPILDNTGPKNYLVPVTGLVAELMFHAAEAVELLEPTAEAARPAKG